MSTTESEELTDLIERRYDYLGRRATHKQLLADVLLSLEGHYKVTGTMAHLVLHSWERGVSKAVSGFLNRRNAHTGLPFAPVANSLGQHVPVELMQFKELQFVGDGYLKRASGQSNQAERVSNVAFSRYGIALDLSQARTA